MDKFDEALWPNWRLFRKSFFFSLYIFVVALLCWQGTFWYMEYRAELAEPGELPSRWIIMLGVWSFRFMLASPIVLLMSIVQADRKNPAIAFSSKGLFMNRLGWHRAFFDWSEIDSIEEVQNEKWGKGVIVHLVSLEEAIAKPEQKFQSFLKREYIRKKKPIIINREFLKGNVDSFNEQLTTIFPSN